VSSPGTIVAADDNLVPGQTYTFTFTLKNLLSMPSGATLISELSQNAPAFISNVQVNSQSGLGLLTNYYDVTFTYSGDGSDVASDVAAEMVSAFAAGTGGFFGGDSLELTSMNSGTVGLSAASDASAVGAGVGSTVGNLLGSAASAATQNASFDILLVIALVIGGAVLLFELGGVSGVKKQFA
jgi:hypothetical protein